MLIVYNAKVYTLNTQQPFASAVAIHEDRIQAVGDSDTILSESGVAKTAGNKIQSINAAGRAVIPGLTDAHLHLEKYALSLSMVDCETATKEECLQRITQRASTTPPEEWIQGHGWNQNNWSGGFGNCTDLDRVGSNQPIYLTAKSLHAAWVNSCALRLAGIRTETLDPPGGRIQRDVEGKPTGILFESAMHLIQQVIPPPTQDQIQQCICKVQSNLWRSGLTAVHDFDGRGCFLALQTLHNQRNLKLRVVKNIPAQFLQPAVDIGLHSGFGDDHLRIGSVKMFADGALGPRTAAMLQPYNNEPDNYGILMVDADTLFETGQIAVQNGLSLAIHAIGDRANREVLKAFARLRQYEKEIRPNQVLLRHRIEHVQLLSSEDIHRFSELGIIASMQPIHATSDMLMADRYWGKRAANSYAWRGLLGSGAKLAFGSDAPVESPNPFLGLHAAVTRRRKEMSSDADAWYPEQKLSVLQALNAFTQGSAYAANLENRSGMLAPGYLADLLILDNDPFTSPPDDLWRIKPVAVMIGGDWVYREI